ncbi:autotransporter-associated beta strand repeat-containing protein [Roseimicrobium sp. ORNL1]|uniref:autotransporter-associated beta strand repeat-containing protein n=1 Tax=Roseimicrobium sp. ORNL1 TaxID=2711231 RepID=UPI0013E190E3|nr:autotransporter-associated beta strand repeat-containing protein [Roseimicrobium sp. ORNL1]QIF00993.1 PEP-CTERM sorting domain-containing protein [Roseimicrobium sp. ORNL1]
MPPFLMRPTTTRATLAILGALLSVSALPAQDVYTGATDATWSNNGNWLDGSEPTLTDAVQFPSLIPGTGAAITLSAGELAASLSFLNSYQLTGGDLTLAAATSINVAPTFTASIGSTLAGAGTSLTKSGNGTLVLTGANTFIGALNITAGVVNAQNNAALGTSAGGTSVTAGAALELQNNITITGEALALNGTGIGNTGGLRNISGTNSFTGTVTLGSAASIISDSGTLTLSAVSTAFATTIGGGGDINITGTFSGAGTWNKVGTGTLTITADPSITGLLTIDSGLVVLNHSGTTEFGMTINSGGTLRTLTASLGDTTSDMTINAGGTFDFRSGSDTMGGLSGTGAGLVTRGVAGAATLTVNNGNETTSFSGVIENGAGTINITKNGTGVLTLTGTNTYTGTTTVGTGGIVINGPNGAIASTVINIGDNNGGGESMVWGAVGDVVAGTLNRISDSANVTLNGTTSGGLTMNGPAATSGGNEEVIGTLTASAGRNTLTLVAGTGNSTQLTATNFVRTNAGVLVVRGADLGGTAVGSTRLVVSTNPNNLLTGAGGGDGTTSKSIIRYMLGDSSTTGSGSGFVTYDSVTGVRLLTAGEYDSTIAGTNQPLRNVSTTGETVTADESINSLRITGGGTVSIGAGNYVRVASGAVLLVGNGVSGGTISGAGALDFGSTEGIITLSQNTSAVTAELNATLAGTAGLTLSRSSDVTTSIINVGGVNTAIGTFTVNQGTVVLTSAAALNDKYPMTVILRTGAALQLNGNNVTIRDLQGTSGSGTYSNGAAGAATLTTYLTGNRSLQTVLANGGTGALNLIVSSGVGQTNTLTIDADASATGTAEVRQGILLLTGSNGTLNDFTGYSINGGTIRLTSTSSANNTNRLRDATGITFNSGTLDFDNNATAANYAETVGAVTLASGANAITVDKAASGQTSVLTLTSLSRAAGSGATLNISSQTNGTAIFDLGTTTQSRLVINGTVPNDDGILGGWATIDSALGREFVKYVASGTISATALVAGDYSVLTSGSNPTQNVKVSATPGAALASNTEINSLNIQQASATTLDLGGNTLRVESGGIIVSGAFNATINNGTLTAGNGANTAGELIFHTVGPVANPVDVNAVIADNGTGVVTLVKTGVGLLDLSGVTNTYTGRTYINGGTLRISSDANLGTAPGAAVADSLVLSGGSTLEVIANMTLNANRGIAVGPGANIISMSSGTAGNGRTLTYNGAISSTGGGEGSLHFKSNVATGSTDAGKLTATLSSVNLTGSLRVDAGSVTVTGATTNIGRSLQVGMDGTATMTYNSAGGSLTVGKGINDTLDIGVSSSDVLNTDGTLDLTALNNFTARVDLVRIGRASTNFSGRGTLRLAVNNDIVAGTSFIVGDTANAGNNVNNILEFGQGINTITTRTFTVGGNKSRATATVRAGGTVNLKGFAENTLDMNVGVYGNTGTASLTSTFDMTGGTLNASLNNLVIGQKTGGAAGGTTGIFTVTGTGNDITANNMVLGNVTGNNTSATSATAGTLNFGGGSLVVNNDIAMATYVNNTATPNQPTSAGTLNITGGVVTVGGNITRTVDAGFETRANSFIHVNGGTLDMQDETNGDTTKGNIAVSQLAFRSGSMVDVGTVTLAATSSTLGTVPGAVAGDALILGSNLTASFDVELTGATGGNIHYVNTGSGATTLDGDVDLGTVNRIINVENTTLQGYELFINGVISNAAAITKQGTGTLALRGDNTYTGTTTVSAGTLQVGYMGTGSTGTGATTVNSGATLGGTGTVKGALVTHNINGNLSPGDLSEITGMENVSTFGILKFEGNVIVGSSAVLTLHMGGGTTPGVNYDQITGLTAGATFVLDGTINTADGSDNFLALPIYTPSFGETWHLIDWTTSLDLTSFNVGTNFRTGADAAGNEGDLDLPNLTPYGLFWDVSNFANDGTVSIVPEPSRMLLLLAGVMGLVMRRRRKTAVMA